MHCETVDFLSTSHPFSPGVSYRIFHLSSHSLLFPFSLVLAFSVFLNFNCALTIIFPSCPLFPLFANLFIICLTRQRRTRLRVSLDLPKQTSPQFISEFSRYFPLFSASLSFAKWPLHFEEGNKQLCISSDIIWTMLMLTLLATKWTKNRNVTFCSFAGDILCSV